MLIKKENKYRNKALFALIVLFFGIGFLVWLHENKVKPFKTSSSYLNYPEPTNADFDYPDATLDTSKTQSFIPWNLVEYRIGMKQPSPLPVVSLTGAASEFFGSIGLYSVDHDNPQDQDITARLHMELVSEGGEQLFYLSAKAKVAGLSTRKNPVKSLNLYLGQELTANQIFKDAQPYKLKSLRLRSAGNDFLMAYMRDVVVSELVKKTNLLVLDYEPVVVYINGEYWGIQYIREIIGEKYILGRFPSLSRDQVILGEFNENQVFSISNGFDYKMEKLMKLLETQDLNTTENFEKFVNAINIKNFIDYIVVQTFISNTDWPHNNVKAVFLDDQLHFILYDTDISLGYAKEYFQHTNDFYSLPERYHQVNEVEHPFYDSVDYYMSTPVGRMHSKLMQYDFYRQQYVSRYKELLETDLSQDAVEKTVKKIREQIEPVMPAHIARWGYPESVESWIDHTNQIIDFSAKRREFILKNLKNKADTYTASTH